MEKMDIKRLREAATQLRGKAERVLAYGHQESLDDAWRDLHVLYAAANQILVYGLSLDWAMKNWESVVKYAEYVEMECDRFDPTRL